MYLEELESIGLSKNEGKIYEVLIHFGELSVSEISSKSGVHRRNVYDTVQRLIKKGLVFHIFQKKENLYAAVNPEKLLEIIKGKERKLRKILPSLKKFYARQSVEEAAFIYRGLEGFKNYMKDLLRVGDTTYFLGAKALWFSPGIEKSFLENFQKEMKKKSLTYYTIFDYRVKKELPQAIKEVRGEYRILPKDYSTPGVCDIFGDYVVTFGSAGVGNFGEDGTIFVMRNENLAESFKTWFKFIWNACEEK